ncbi:hypothetical protein HMPREF3034_00404 [Prevotella sp. DNF00663]|nr:hypothetical protein HMPREF0671_00135 [Prevotella sp. S7 MS 2]KXB85223.1 hypothetical protein HMPREF3034_00404 [Prevotella sp. DNF00663]
MVFAVNQGDGASNEWLEPVSLSLREGRGEVTARLRQDCWQVEAVLLFGFCSIADVPLQRSNG